MIDTCSPGQVMVLCLDTEALQICYSIMNTEKVSD